MFFSNAMLVKKGPLAKIWYVHQSLVPRLPGGGDGDPFAAPAGPRKHCLFQKSVFPLTCFVLGAAPRLAAHSHDKKLSKANINDTDIKETVTSILQPAEAFALRLSGQLLLGVCRIYQKKVPAG